MALWNWGSSAIPGWDRLSCSYLYLPWQVRLSCHFEGGTKGTGYSSIGKDSYAEELLPLLHSLFTGVARSPSLLDSMSDAVIVMILKLRKDTNLCSPSRYIGLLNADVTLLAKILANRLNTMITILVHPDQSEIMPGRGTDINIRRLHMTLAGPDHLGDVASLDAGKTFNH